MRIEISTAVANEIKFFSGNASETANGRIYVDSNGYMYVTSPVISGATGSTPYLSISKNTAAVPSYSAIGLNARDVYLSPDNDGSVHIDKSSSTAASLDIYSYGSAATLMIKFRSENVSPAPIYAIYCDNVGALGGTGRLWIDCVGSNLAGEMHFGPRAGSTYLNGIRFLTDTVNLRGFTTTSAAAANIGWNSTTFYLYKSTSSERYKDKIEYLPEPMWGLLAINPIRYKSLTEFDTVGKGMEDDTADISRDWVGAVAEDFDALGLFEFVEYDADGMPDWLMYERISVFLIPMIRDLRDRLVLLEKKGKK
jgi:hypothetical protein